ncbi:GntR family transcriptional regulator [Leucobacter coleopterorum]|uniref:GntR family transcriptional regulator n=1 Tax=Leucobacter coleopterorum TaxID=2714933 RepID=A0ABX6JXV1_9MICO|nr:GntR family transcriptional regulator [Leucobacter coleopterorum]QIM19138.1 GntR family transcriptional regulator [Leucobacter coleopterorum]
MLIRVDETSKRAIYAQIADSVRTDISAGRVGPGSVLPPAREVAVGLGINVHTVLRAYQLLRHEGLIDLKRRRGAVVTQAATAIAELRAEAEALVAHAEALGVSRDALAALIAGSETSGHSSTQQSEEIRGGTSA